MSEPGVRVFARSGDGTETDITEGVQTLYDLVISSMDWGSGFLTVEEAEPVVHVAKTCQFKGWEVAQRYVDNQRHSHEQAAFLAEHGDVGAAAYWWRLPGLPAHDHVFSSPGRCMWPRCQATRP